MTLSDASEFARPLIPPMAPPVRLIVPPPVSEPLVVNVILRRRPRRSNRGYVEKSPQLQIRHLYGQGGVAGGILNRGIGNGRGVEAPILPKRETPLSVGLSSVTVPPVEPADNAAADGSAHSHARTVDCLDDSAGVGVVGKVVQGQHAAIRAQRQPVFTNASVISAAWPRRGFGRSPPPTPELVKSRGEDRLRLFRGYRERSGENCRRWNLLLQLVTTDPPPLSVLSARFSDHRRIGVQSEYTRHQ